MLYGFDNAILLGNFQDRHRTELSKHFALVDISQTFHGFSSVGQIYLRQAVTLGALQVGGTLSQSMNDNFNVRDVIYTYRAYAMMPVRLFVCL